MSSSRIHLSHKLSVWHCIVPSTGTFWGKPKNFSLLCLIAKLPQQSVNFWIVDKEEQANKQEKTHRLWRKICMYYPILQQKFETFWKLEGFAVGEESGLQNCPCMDVTTSNPCSCQIVLFFFFIIVACSVWNMHLCLTEPSLHIYFDMLSPIHLVTLPLPLFYVLALHKDISISTLAEPLTGVWFRKYLTLLRAWHWCHRMLVQTCTFLSMDEDKPFFFSFFPRSGRKQFGQFCVWHINS